MRVRPHSSPLPGCVTLGEMPYLSGLSSVRPVGKADGAEHHAQRLMRSGERGLSQPQRTRGALGLGSRVDRSGGAGWWT